MQTDVFSTTLYAINASQFSHKRLIRQTIFQLNQMFGFLRRTPVTFFGCRLDQPQCLTNSISDSPTN